MISDWAKIHLGKESATLSIEMIGRGQLILLMQDRGYLDDRDECDEDAADCRPLVQHPLQGLHPRNVPRYLCCFSTQCNQWHCLWRHSTCIFDLQLIFWAFLNNSFTRLRKPPSSSSAWLVGVEFQRICFWSQGIIACNVLNLKESVLIFGWWSCE